MRQDHLNKVLSISSESAKIQQKAIELAKEHILDAARMIELAIESGNKLLICGNGGSAADAQHLAGEFINRFRRERAAYPAIALTTDSSVLTCISNDYLFENIFSRQVEALGMSGDILVAISTSGNSKNVVKAAAVARKNNLKVISLTGICPNELSNNSDITLEVPSSDTPRVQEAHEIMIHILCEIVEGDLVDAGE